MILVWLIVLLLAAGPVAWLLDPAPATDQAAPEPPEESPHEPDDRG